MVDDIRYLRGVSHRGDNDNCHTACGLSLTITDGVGETVIAIEVTGRGIGKGAVSIVGERAVGGLGKP